MRVQITDLTCKPTIAYKTVNRYTYNEVMERFKKEGFLTDTIMIRLWDFIGYPDPKYVIIRELVDIVNSGTHGITVDSYEVVGSDKEDIFLKVTLKKGLF